MTEYHFYTGSYLNREMTGLLTSSEAYLSPARWNDLMINPCHTKNKKVIHVLFYESLLTAMREIRTNLSQSLSDSETYNMTQYLLATLCSKMLEDHQSTAGLQSIHFVYSSGEKRTLKNSVKSNESYLMRMSEELDYRFTIEHMVDKYTQHTCCGEDLIKIMMKEQLLPRSYLAPCCELIEWNRGSARIDFRKNDEYLYFEYYRMYVQTENSHQHFHAYKEDQNMQKFFDKLIALHKSKQEKPSSYVHHFAYSTHPIFDQKRSKEQATASAAEKAYWLNYDKDPNASREEQVNF